MSIPCGSFFFSLCVEFLWLIFLEHWLLSLVVLDLKLENKMIFWFVTLCFVLSNTDNLSKCSE